MPGIGRIRRSFWLRLAILTVAVVVGCNRGPRTFPVQGKVVSRGGKAWSGGMIQFTSVADPQVVATGEIQPDGTFRLVTHYAAGTNAKSKPGAVEGEHHIYLDEPLPQVDTDGVVVIRPIVVSKTYRVESKENEFTIEAQRLGKP